MAEEDLFLRSAISFLHKILNKPMDSLIYKCYTGLRSSSGVNARNWFNQFKSFFSKHGLGNILNCPDIEVNNRDFIPKVTTALERAESDSLARDIARMRESKFFGVYVRDKTHVRIEPFLESTYCWTK